MRDKDRSYKVPPTIGINNITISAIWSQLMRNNRGFKVSSLFSHGFIFLLRAIILDEKYAVKVDVHGGCI